MIAQPVTSALALARAHLHALARGWVRGLRGLVLCAAAIALSACATRGPTLDGPERAEVAPPRIATVRPDGEAEGLAEAANGARQDEVYLQDPLYRELIQQSFLAIQSRLAFPCNRVRGTDSHVLVVEPMEFEAGGDHPADGSWLQIVEFERCGVPQSQSLQVNAKPDVAPEIAALVPGFSQADPRLQLDILFSSVLPKGAERFAGTCAPTQENTIVTAAGERVLAPRVIDSYIGSVSDGGRGGVLAWTELWMLELCNSITPLSIAIENVEGRSPPSTFLVTVPEGRESVPVSLLDSYPDLNAAWREAPEGPAPVAKFTTFGTGPAL
ncbi:MAG: hypothetical protein AAGB03_08025 [Pseudomonadota bacterium]